jgi:hypothetical protein
VSRKKIRPTSSGLAQLEPAAQKKIRILKVNQRWYIQKPSVFGLSGSYCDSWEEAIESANSSIWLWQQPYYRERHGLD